MPMKKKKHIKNDIIVYKAKTGAIELKGDASKDTMWVTQAQISDIFGVERSVVTKHINNILKDGEVDEKRNVQKMHIANSDKPVAFYSLDLILAVGYRTNSAKAIGFRQWATKTLREYITKGYAINRTQIKHNYFEFTKAVENLRSLLPTSGSVDNSSVLELISAFSSTWFSLDAYDKDKLTTAGVTKRSVTLTAEQLSGALAKFKEELIKKGEATDLFGTERSPKNIESIVGNVMQSLGGRAVYLTVEAKAAHLLYFMVKNHPFVDGNKRSGAFAFVWFLKKSKALNPALVTPATLTALTVLVAESDPKNKERMIKLIMQLLR